MKPIKKYLPLVLGGAGGFAYWYFIGCLSGTCPLTSQWWTSTAYGMIIGATFLLGRKKTPGD